MNSDLTMRQIGDNELDKKIYRFVSFDALLEIISYNRITLPKVSTWVLG
ncbi:hypothetical protein [Parapedobacter koreensis]|nr:hypothetical protein [Parapedobacter koreensis]